VLRELCTSVINSAAFQVSEKVSIRP